MDRALIVSLLQTAEDRVANGEQDITDQVDIISTLERTGHAANSAIARLRQLEQTQMQCIAEREWFRAELAVLDVKARATEAHASK